MHWIARSKEAKKSQVEAARIPESCSTECVAVTVRLSHWMTWKTYRLPEPQNECMQQSGGRGCDLTSDFRVTGHIERR
jgi:hypothetical protein